MSLSYFFMKRIYAALPTIVLAMLLFCVCRAKAQDTLAVDTLVTDSIIPNVTDSIIPAVTDSIVPAVTDSVLPVVVLPRPAVLDESMPMTVREMAHMEMSYVPVPLVVAGLATWWSKGQFRDARNRLEPRFSVHFDDYIQYAPLAATAILKVAGVKSRSNWGRFLASGAMSYAIMAGLCNGLKYSVRELRPDGSSRNSFPSGHTATAFAAATILHKEYGLTRSPWYSVGGYAIATTTGVMRTLNNRHWVSDVLVGAAIGIVSVDLGYFIGDVIFKDKGMKLKYRHDKADLQRTPSFFNLSMGVGYTSNINLPNELSEWLPGRAIKSSISTSAAVEGAYFINPYVGFGGRLRIITTPMTTNATTLYTYQVGSNNISMNKREITTGDQQSAFCAELGVYGAYPFTRRFSIGGKLLLGRTRVGAMHFDYQTLENEYADDLEVSSGASFLGAAGFSLTYAYRHGFAWKLGIDYDFSRPQFTVDYRPAGLNDLRESYSIRPSLHHLTVSASMNIMF